MRFIGNNHALHFGGVTFVNRVTLVQEVREELAHRGRTPHEQDWAIDLLNTVVDKLEEELREELRQKHYHHDLHMPEK
ncbi:MAG: hypothetical protein BWX88_03907 [Planctomycetes bacterium ADurb.Bin126]|nr:MAG: hypothetical protein BWX88_03907 [Planctomycetes bacterium ADurb.Bin126]HOD81445.1 hypothetical protein [Phycisphaerae bacterium]HQL75851.1 hypothetical protein [Phycisphaerae bacterium]